jgi:hypothetical protein
MQGLARSGNFGELIVTRAGVYLYGMATLAAGIFDLIWGDFDADHRPIQAFGDHIPGVKILAYITAVWMIAGGAAILWRGTAKAGAAALAVIYFVFTVFWLPRLYTAPHFLGLRISVYVGVLAGFGSQLIVAAAGALVYAVAGNAQFSLILAANDSYRPLDIWALLSRLRLGAFDRHCGQPGLCPQVDAAGSGVLGDRNWNMLRARGPCHALGNFGRSGGAAACAHVFGF